MADVIEHKVNVTVIIPNRSVESMLDEIDRGQVDAAVNEAVAAYKPFDSDARVEFEYYSHSLNGAVDTVFGVAARTEGPDLLVVLSDGVASNWMELELQLATLKDDFVVIVPVNNQPNLDNKAKLEALDNSSPKAHLIDLVELDDLPGVEVPEWLCTKIDA